MENEAGFLVSCCEFKFQVQFSKWPLYGMRPWILISAFQWFSVEAHPGPKAEGEERQEVSKGNDSAPRKAYSLVSGFFLVVPCGLSSQRLNLRPHQGQLRVLTTRPPANSPPNVLRDPRG